MEFFGSFIYPTKQYMQGLEPAKTCEALNVFVTAGGLQLRKERLTALPSLTPA